MNINMRKISVLILLFVISIVKLDADTINNANVYLLGKRHAQNMRLRWAVSTPNLWEVAKRRGFILERFTFDKKTNDSLSLTKQIYKIEAVLSQDSNDWHDIINKNDYAALFAQALYGKDFNMHVFGQNQWASIAKEIEETQLRFSMAMLACDRSFETACMGKMGYEDVSVRYGEKYLYRIYIDTSAVIADTALFYTDMSYLDEPIASQALEAKFEDKIVELRWNPEIFQNSFTAYNVERSFDKKNFIKCNRVPIVQSQLNQENPAHRDQMVYTDSLIDNETLYYYRVLGIDIFGEQTLITNVAHGKGKSKNIQEPNILKADLLDVNTLLLVWDFPISENEKIRRFKLWNKSAMYANYVVVDTLITTQERRKSIAVNSLFPSNYFVLEVESMEGEIKSSRNFFYQLLDTIPPAIPLQLTYKIDTNGIVNIQWDSVSDLHLSGYRIFRSNNLHTEYVQISSDVFSNPMFCDSLSLTTAKSVYYKVVSIDYRGNMSDFSMPLQVERPVKNLPAAPVFAYCHYRDCMVFLSWFNSTEEEVDTYKVYQKKNQEAWECIYTGGKLQSSSSYQFREKDSLWVTLKGRDALYAFKVVSITDKKDTVVSPFFYTLEYKQQLEKPKLQAYAHRDKKCIAIQWDYPQMQEVKNYYLYRKEEKGSFRLLQIVKNVHSLHLDVHVKMNTHYAYCLRVEGINGVWSDYSDAYLINY
ncbi:MAG: hypothetical protein RR328_01480 [Bacteroidales bacterium]